MTFRQYIISIVIGTLCAFIGAGIVVTSTDPATSGPLAFVLFYLSAFTIIVGALSILGLFMRVYVLRKKSFLAKQVAIAFRQSVLLGGLFTGALVLQSMNILTWFNTVLLVGALTMLEFFIISLRRRT